MSLVYPSSKSPIEGMAEFFDARASGYEDHMKSTIEDFDRFYATITDTLPATDAPLAILDLGIGTGLELAGLFERLPNARVTGIDLSSNMLGELQRKHAHRAKQIHTIQGSFLDVDFGCGVYNAVLSAMALHHHPVAEKTALYRRINDTLVRGGLFVYGDYVVDVDEAAELIAQYEDAIRRFGDAAQGPVHFDIPFSVDREIRTLRAAGFREIEVLYRSARVAVFRAG